MSALSELLAAFPGRSALLSTFAILALAAFCLVLEGLSLKLGRSYSLLTHRISCLVMIVMIYLFQPASNHAFIYFNF